jgi:hypothetical protein
LYQDLVKNNPSICCIVALIYFRWSHSLPPPFLLILLVQYILSNFPYFPSTIPSPSLFNSSLFPKFHSTTFPTASLALVPLIHSSSKPLGYCFSSSFLSAPVIYNATRSSFFLSFLSCSISPIPSSSHIQGPPYTPTSSIPFQVLVLVIPQFQPYPETRRPKDIFF